MSRRSRIRTVLSSLFVAAIATAIALEAAAVTLGNVNVVLQTHQYYSSWDLTRFVYRVRTKRGILPDRFVLAAGPCLQEASAIYFSMPWYAWVEEPFAGLAFDIYSSNQQIHLWLNGRWDGDDIEMALLYAPSDAAVGRISGPACEPQALSLSVVDGGNVEFPAIVGPGSYPVEGATTLRITGDTANWALSHAVAFDVPQEASEETVARIFKVQYDPYQPRSGATDVDVSYALAVTEEDFVGLPEGDYVIHVTFTVAEN
jgi:hypothetical protein